MRDIDNKADQYTNEGIHTMKVSWNLLNLNQMSFSFLEKLPNSNCDRS